MIRDSLVGMGPPHGFAAASYVGGGGGNDHVYGGKEDGGRDSLNPLEPDLKSCDRHPQVDRQCPFAPGDGERVFQRIPVSLPVFHGRLIAASGKLVNLGSVPDKSVAESAKSDVDKKRGRPKAASQG